MKNKNWFNHLLFSYLPAFLIIFVALVFIFVVFVNESIKSYSEDSIKVFSESAIDLFEQTLSSADDSITKELVTNQGLQQFFESINTDDFFMFQTQEILKNITIFTDFINSIYIYRHRDGLVLSNVGKFNLGEFSDREYIEQLSALPQGNWNAPRIYKAFSNSDGSRVISLVKKVPFGSENQGLMVVNLDSQKLGQHFKEITESGVSYIYVSGSDDQFIFEENKMADAEVLYRTSSELTGWTLSTYKKSNKSLSAISSLIQKWIVMGFVIFLASFIWIYYISRRNYKPIESILAVIQHYSLKKGELNEFKFIESSIEKLLEQSQQSQEQHKKDFSYRKKHYFNMLIEGERPLFTEESRPDLLSLGLKDGAREYVVLFLDIDRYVHFVNMYNVHDQNLLKFALHSVLNEMAAIHGLWVWNEWLDPTRMSIFMQFDQPGKNKAAVVKYSYELKNWIGSHLNMTVTIGIGEFVDELTDAALSYRTAVEVLKHKVSFGANQVIGHWEIQWNRHGAVFNLMTHIRSMVDHFRQGKEEWKDQFELLFHKLRGELMSNEEVSNLIDYTLFYLTHEMGKLSSDYQEICNGLFGQRSDHPLLNCETLEEYYTEVSKMFSGLWQRMSQIREESENNRLIQKAVCILEAQYSNPNLSLLQVCEEIAMHPSLFSRLFRDELGEKFVDYLANLRVEHAKQKLLATEDSIQDIANQVGYVHSYSFIRMFKKIVGKTPGDFRKMCEGERL